MPVALKTAFVGPVAWNKKTQDTVELNLNNGDAGHAADSHKKLLSMSKEFKKFSEGGPNKNLYPLKKELEFFARDWMKKLEVSLSF